jgi:excisionase family DNA binding protein
MAYLTTEDAAARLKLSRRFLEALRRTGGGPTFISFGRAVRYCVDDVDAWAASRKRASTSDTGKAGVQ